MADTAEGRDWLLRLVAAGGEGATVDPIRIMKGAFLLTQELAKHQKGTPYEFVPYHYGPCSFDVYRDLDTLVSERLLAREYPSTSRRWPIYRVTPAGLARIAELAHRLPADWSQYVLRLRAWLDQQTFESLLRYIYAAYPGYARATVLPALVPQQ